MTNKNLKKESRKTVLVFLLFVLFLIPKNTVAQHKELYQVGEFGGGLGTLNYIGDLNPQYNFKVHRPAVNLFFRRNILDEVWVIRTNLMLGAISADESKLNDPFKANRGYKFSSTVAELALTIEYNFFDFRSEKELKIHRIHSPYLMAGVAIASIIQGQSETQQVQNPTTGSFVFGPGIKVKISHNLNFGAEMGIRYTFNDNLDGINNNDLLNTSTVNDLYIHTGVFLSYTILSDICPDKNALKGVYRK